MDNRQNQQVSAVIQKVSVFKGFNLTEAQRLLKLCKPQKYRKSEVIFRAGEPSKEYVATQDLTP